MIKLLKEIKTILLALYDRMSKEQQVSTGQKEEKDAAIKRRCGYQVVLLETKPDTSVFVRKDKVAELSNKRNADITAEMTLRGMIGYVWNKNHYLTWQDANTLLLLAGK